MTAFDIPGYVIRREVGVGGMASVYQALQTSLDREVALKVMAPALAADPTFSKRFMQEARMLASLAHPNIVQVYDVGVTSAQLHYFSMQYLPGGDFAQRVRLGVTEKDLLRILEGVANALGYAHHRGYVHRDVAPGNILFDVNDTPLLTDFGIARAFSQTARITSTGISVGTSHYMSPEQARGSDVDARSDLYGLGVLTYFGLTGRPPYEGADGFAVSYAHVFEPIPRLPAAKAHWQGLIDKAMAKEPVERFQDADEFIAALGSIVPAAASATPEPAEAATRVLQRESVATALRSSEAPTRIGVLPSMAESAAASSTNSEVEPAQEPGRAWLAWGLAGLGAVLIAAVALVYFMGRDEPKKQELAVVPPPVREVAKKEAVAEPVPAPAAEQPDSPESADLTTDPGTSIDLLGADQFTEMIDLASIPTVVDPVKQLVRLARADLAAQRLMTPPRANAFERFSLALRINPATPEAKQGIVDTGRAYLDLADKALKEDKVGDFAEYLAKADEVAASISEGAELLGAIRARRKDQVDRYLGLAESAARKLDAAAARAAYEQALAIDKGNDRARRGLSGVDKIGKSGYVFRDALPQGNGPELVVVSPGLAFARRETTRGEFSRWWQAEGRSRFAGKSHSCRDRESIFRSSRKRDWQQPGITQDDNHPVVCVSFAAATGYAQWLSAQSGYRYRLPTPAEWQQVARKSPAGSCTSANLADAAYKKAFDSRSGADCDDGFSATAPVGRFPAVDGIFDLDGNVREWVAACGNDQPLNAGCSTHGVRGRGWVSDPASDTLLDVESYSEDVGLNSLGFRVVREIDQ